MNKRVIGLLVSFIFISFNPIAIFGINEVCLRAECLGIQPIILGEGVEDVCVNCHGALMFEDTIGLAAYEVLTVLDSGFRPSQLSWPHNQHVESAYWYMFAIQPELGAKPEWTLEFMDPHVGEIDVYELTENGLVHLLESGMERSFEHRKTKHKNHIVHLSLTDTTTTVFVVKFRGHLISSLRGHLVQDHAMLSYAVGEYYYLGIFYGILLLLLLYSLSLYLFNRDVLYLEYAFYVIASGLLSFNEDGIGFQMLWSNWPLLNMFLARWSLFIFNTAFVLFGLRLLRLKVNFPTGRWAVLAGYGVFVIYHLLAGKTEFVSVAALLPAVTLFCTAIVLSAKGMSIARYFVVGYSFILVGQLLLFLRLKGVLSNISENPLLVYVINISLIGEILVLAVAMAQKVRQESKEKSVAQQRVINSLIENEKLKDKVNRELEAKVKERTADLEIRNAQMKAQAEEIERMNDVLKGRNIKLQEERIMLKEMTFEEFQEAFPSEERCLLYLSDLKWSDGFKCKKCGHQQFSAGRKPYSRRCSSCSHEESVTAFTLLHHLRFSVQKAFYLTYLVLNKPNITTTDLVGYSGLSKAAVWQFKKRVLNARAKHKKGRKSGWDGLLLSQP